MVQEDQAVKEAETQTILGMEVQEGQQMMTTDNWSKPYEKW